VNFSMCCGFVGKKVTTHIRSWNDVWYSTMGTANIKFKTAENSAPDHEKMYEKRERLGK
jgi:hypothetical protein